MRLRWDRLLAITVLVAAAGCGIWLLRIEMKASVVQARVLSQLAEGMTYHVGSGPAPEPRFAGGGPYDVRNGYTRLPDFLAFLEQHHYRVERQARLSPQLSRFIDLGGFPIFPEKSQAGLTILDRVGDPVYIARHPEQVFPDFASIPHIVVETLLFIENRELLAGEYPARNPAVEWDRFSAAAANVIADKITPTGQRFGGSTLATQIEKYRHSPEGRTGSVTEKLRQIASASLRAYRDGPNTFGARQRIVLDYLNSTPLSARPGFGEVIGIGDGLWAWYGTDLGSATKRLSLPIHSDVEARDQALIYKQVLSLLLAQRRPSYYLLAGRDDLARLTDSYLRVLADAGVISPELRDGALAASLQFRTHPPAPAEFSFVDRKAINAIRAHLLSLLRLDSFYELDRLDLTVRSTLDMSAQQQVIDLLRRFSEPAEVGRLGLVGARLLSPETAPSVRYSVTIYERGPLGNVLRVQADNLDRPLDLNEGGKLDLGSTAKLRTLVTYLEIVAELHRRYGRLSPTELLEATQDASDPLTQWSIRHLQTNSDRSLQRMLDAAMLRRYSASPGESFFTGRGMHTFANFDRVHDGQIMTVADAFRHSVNLVFIRMMRDIVSFHMADGPEPAREVLASPHHPARADYLTRFADMEGTVFLDQFLRRYRGRSADEALAILASRSRPTPHRIAVVFRSVRPAAGLDEFGQFMRARLPETALSDGELFRLYTSYSVDRFNLHDRGYIARVHPLELWLVQFLQRNPNASRAAILAASVDIRQEVYHWLFRLQNQSRANSRIRIVLEQEAFKRIHASWQRLGYPFPELVPSYATAIGSSADRPAALAELMGIILNDGVRLPMVRVDHLAFAENTPYEAHVAYGINRVERVLPKELARTVRRALEDVVANGTARRVNTIYRDEARRPLPVGGKTGTGDELADSLSAGQSAGRDVSRSAAFVFFIGDRHFGVITAHVPGRDVRRFTFTSALPVQVLATLEPALRVMIQGGEAPHVGPVVAETASGGR